jgi:hypothetical protein
MRFFILPPLVLLASCAPPHQFDVDVHGAEVQSAELILYGSATPLERVGNHFTGDRAARADGDGRIVVTLSDGRQIICPIGYVTDGEQEPHRFVLTGDRCLPQ